ncbi:MAG TPA: DUF4380 domain-containing protein [Acidimicrobiales bacterium]
MWLDNGVLRLGAVPALGGRLLSVQVHGVETLWRNPAHLDDDLHPVGGHSPRPTGGELGDWVNYGGDKTWPAPQGWSGPGEWAGPPDPVLDSGPYDWELHEDDVLTLTMTSGADPRTGLQLVRKVVLGPDAATYDLVLHGINVSDRVVRWALWNVTQRRAGVAGHGGVDIGVGPALDGSSVVAPVLAGTGVPRTEPRGPGVVRVPHQDVVGKVGFPTATGWLAHVANGTTCTQRFQVVPRAEYPDGGSRVEVWLEHPLDQPLAALGNLDPPDRIVEVEVLGPLVELAPGERTQLTISCAAVVEETTEVLEVAAEGHRTPTGWTSYEQRRDPQRGTP